MFPTKLRPRRVKNCSTCTTWSRRWTRRSLPSPALLRSTRASFRKSRPEPPYYRGSPNFARSGLYAELVSVGGLQPYARWAEDLVELQFDRYREWLAAMERAGVGRRIYEEAGDGLLDAAWNPVRLNPHGTVELRRDRRQLPDGHPGYGPPRNRGGRAGPRRRAERQTHGRSGDSGKVDGHFLRVPDLEYVGEKLFREAAISGCGEPGSRRIHRFYLRVRR